MATVVSALRLRVESVTPRSVESTVISLIVRISVVLPAAKGPVTTILTAWPPLRRRFAVVMSQPPDTGDEAEQQALVHAGIPFDEAGGAGDRVVGDGGGGDDRPDRAGPSGADLVGVLGAPTRR